MRLSDLLVSDSTLYAKSEFGPAQFNWPALSFSSQKIARDFQARYRRGRDFVIYVGTSNPADTPEASHRQRLLSVVEVEPRTIISTKDIVSSDAWDRAQQQYAGRWDVSLPLAQAWGVVDLPRAHEKLPATYATFSNPGTRGHPIPVLDSDRTFLLPLSLAPVTLNYPDECRKRSG